MRRWPFILAIPIALHAWQNCAAQNAIPAGQPVAAPYGVLPAPQPIFLPEADCTQPPVIIPETDCTQSQPIFIDPAPVMPIYPPQSTVVPLPSHTPGTIFGPPAQGGVAPGTVPQSAVGVPPGVMPGPGGAAPPVATGPANPILVPVVDEELAWDQIVDVVTDYFTVAREQQARRGGEAWSEGRIETAPLTGATWLEPQRHDSVGNFNRWESTFQTIRRRATVRVMPDAAGFLVEVIVEKELEDLPAPEGATAGSYVFRTDTSLPTRRREEVSRLHSSPRWLQLGRDPELEQRMLADIHARLNGVAAHRSVFAP
jgi:hypothetical protein